MKRLSGVLLALLLASAALEGAAALYFWLDRGHLPYAGPTDKLEPAAAAAFHVADAVFHPYAGYVLRAGREGDYLDGSRWRANNHGFHNLIRPDGSACCDYPYLPAEDEIVVGIFGGSVGSGYALSAQIAGSFDTLGDGRAGLWTGKRVTVLNFALPGFKQPQQLMALSYFLNIGQVFDVVIEIDGFNEAVTTYSNWESGAELSYPADTLWGAWGRMLERYEVPVGEKGFHLAAYHRLAGRDARHRARDARLAGLKLLYEAKAGWHWWREGAHAKPAREELEKRAYFPTRFRSPQPPESGIWDATVASWLSASVAMADMARRVGAVYLHILQPNQWDRTFEDYVPRDPDHPYGWTIRPVNRVYPRFRAATARLETAGVAFLDLSGVFAAVDARTVYVDDCCHYTQAGNEVLFTATIEALSEDTIQ